MIRIGLFPNCCRSFARSFSARLAGPESTSRMPWSPTWAVRLMSPGRWIMYTLPCTGSTPISSLFWFCCARMSGANAKKRTQPRMTRITPNGRVKNPLMRPFGVIRVIRGYFSPVLFMQHTARGIPDTPVELVDVFHGSADVFENSCPTFGRLNGVFGQQLEFLDVRIPASPVNQRVFDPHIQFKRVVARAVVSLLKVHLIAVRIAEMIDPGSVVMADRIDEQSVSLPMAGRVSPPSGQVNFLRKRPSIRPDGAP